MLPSSTLSWIRENPAPAYNLLRTTNKFLVLCDGCSADVGRRRCLMPQFENMALIMSTAILCIFDGFVFIYSYSGFVFFSIFLFLINASHNFLLLLLCDGRISCGLLCVGTYVKNARRAEANGHV